ncbi:MAG TPA: ATP-binding protein, partial [Opitutaceae bacterium]
MAWLEEGGELGKLISRYPWESTPLGPLREWPQSLRTAVSLMLSSQHPMWIGWGPNATFLYNDAYISVLSLSKHPWALGRPAQEVWSEIWDVCGPLADKVFQRGQASFVDDVELFMKRGDFLEETYYSFSYSPIRDESGRVGGLFCPSAEVSSKILNARRLATLSELAANSLLEKTVFRACETAFSTLRKNGKDIPFAALYLFDTSGKTLERVQEVGLKKADEKIAPLTSELSASSSAALWPFAEVLNSGRLATVSLPSSEALPTGAGNQRVASAVLLPIAARGYDRPFGFFVAGVNPARQLDQDYRTFYELIAGQIGTAIQNARAAEEQRRRAEELAELDRAKTTFFSNVSHELRTPLTLMLGPLDELSHHGVSKNPDETEKLAEVAHRNGLRLLKLVNTLLDFSRLEAGRLQGHFEPLDLGAYTTELASTFRSAIEKAQLKFIVDAPSGLEPAYIDPNLWEKIILNLLSNALKFTLHGQIEIRLRQVDNMFVLDVKDTGIGIPTEAQTRLFERFYRVEGSRGRTQEGTGIGLALVQDLVKLHGGNIRAESASGVGTNFIVTIPRGFLHLPADRVLKERRQVTSQIANQFTQEALRWNDADNITSALSDFEVEESTRVEAKKAGQVLLVDDNADMRDYVARLLGQRFDVLTASDGEAAIDVLKHTRPDLILSDVMMPRLDGFGLIRAVRAHPEWRTLPVILLSARAGDEARLEGVSESADDYLVKPFSARELLARVSTHLELAKIRRESERKVREADERVRLAVEAAGVGTWTWDIALDRGEWSEAARNVLGIGELNTTAYRDVLLSVALEDDRERAREDIARALSTGGAYQSEVGIVTSAGQRRWIATQGKISFDKNGHPERMTGALVDITERKQAELLLLKQKEVLEQI